MRPLIIVPTYNERKNLPAVVAALLRIPDVRVLVVDDGSPDGTGEVTDADLVIGSRYVMGGRIENWPKRRLLLSAFANRYIRAITGLRTNDTTSGFRCWRRDALQRLPLDRIGSNGYAFLVELVWEAQAAGCRIAEVPITFVERRHGASKLSWRVLVESALVPWRLAARR